MQRAERTHSQRPKDKNRLSASHAPQVESIGNSKALKPNDEFGVKISTAVIPKQGLIL